MKKLIIGTLLSISCVTLLQAEVKYEIMPVVGYNSFDGGSSMSDDILYGVRGTLHMNSLYGYRLGYLRADDIKYSPTVGGKKRTNMQRITADLLVNGEEEYSVIPYFLLGGGYEMLSAQTSKDVSQGFFNGGIGFKYLVSSAVNATLEAKALKKLDTSDLDYMFTFGFGYTFGQRGYEAEIKEPNIFEKELQSLNNNNDLQSSDSDIETIAQIENESVDIASSESKEVLASESKETLAFESKETLAFESKEVPTFEESFKRVGQEETEGYYVQMIALFNEKSDENIVLNSLQSKGYTGVQKDISIGSKDATIVLVGPFESTQSAHKELKNLQKIKDDAFITKL